MPINLLNLNFKTNIIFLLQDCKIPCKRTDIVARRVRKIPKKNVNGVFVTISSWVSVTESIPKMTSLDLISSLGGVLGLTLGLGFLQMAELLDQGLAALGHTCRRARAAARSQQEAAGGVRSQEEDGVRSQEEVGEVSEEESGVRGSQESGGVRRGD